VYKNDNYGGQHMEKRIAWLKPKKKFKASDKKIKRTVTKKIDAMNSNFCKWIETLIYSKCRVTINHENELIEGVITKLIDGDIVLNKMKNGLVGEKIGTYHLTDVISIQDMD